MRTMAMPELSSVTVPPRSLWPREHGAYGQLFVPLVGALALAHARPAAVLLALAVSAVFLAHEPALVVLGHRGARAQRVDGPRARRRLALLGLGALASGVAGWTLAPPEARWACGLPLALATVLAPFVLARRERTFAGELVAACALCSCALPVQLAGGAPVALAAAVVATWAISFCSATFAVRGVIAAGKRRPSAALRSAAVGLAAVGMLLLAHAPGSPTTWLAVGPFGLLGLALAVAPPRPRHLHALGWGLMAASVVSLGTLLFGLS